MSCLTFLRFFSRSTSWTKTSMLETHFPPPDAAKLTYQEETEWLTVKHKQSGKEQQNKHNNKQELWLQSYSNIDGLQLYGAQRDGSAAHREQREALAAHSYKEHHNNEGKQWSTEKQRARESLSFYPWWQHSAQQSKFFFLLHCNKHSNTKGIRSYCI